MCEIIEEMISEHLQEIAKRMLDDGTIAPEKIAKLVDLPLEEIIRLQAGQPT